MAAEPDFLDAAAARVFEAPRRTADSVEWPHEVRAELEGLINEVEFLSRYRLDLGAAPAR